MTGLRVRTTERRLFEPSLPVSIFSDFPPPPVSPIVEPTLQTIDFGNATVAADD
jgi:hypothetical protein